MTDDKCFTRIIEFTKKNTRETDNYIYIYIFGRWATFLIRFRMKRDEWKKINNTNWKIPVREARRFERLDANGGAVPIRRGRQTL